MAEQNNEEFSVANLLQAQRDLLAGSPAAAVPPPAVAGAQPPAATAEDADAYLNLKHYAYVIWGRKWVVLLSIVLVIAAAFVYWMNTKQKYEAVTRIDIGETMPGMGLELFGGRMSYIDAEVLAKLAKKKEVLDDAAALAQERLKAVFEKRGKALPAEERAVISAEIAREKPASVEPVRVGADKYTLVISAQTEGRRRLSSLMAPDEDHAAAILAHARSWAVARALLSYYEKSMSNDSRKQNLQELMDKNDDDLRKINEKLLANSDASTLFTGKLPPGVTDRINLIERQRRDRAETQLKIRELEERAKVLDKFIATPDPANQQVNPQIQARLSELHMQLVQLENRYHPDHPKYQRIKEEIESLTKIKDDANRDPSLSVNPGQAQLLTERRNLNLEIESLKAREKALSEGLSSTEEKIGEGTPDFSKQAALAVEHEQQLRERRMLEDMGQQLRRKMQEVTALGMADKNGRPVVTVGDTSAGRELGAGVGQIIGFAVILGLILGALLVLLLEHLDDTVRSALIAQRTANLPVISRLPLFTGPVSKQFISGSEPRSDVAEIFKVFHNHVRYAAPNAPEKCLLVSSPERDEGKSFVATNLALSFALEGNKVCFVDADLRRSRMHERMEVLRPRGAMDVGLCGYLENGLSYEDVVLPSANENLSVILAGGRASNPPRALRSDRMRALLDRMGREFDVVIIDTPPVLPVVDAVILAPLVRSVIMVARFSMTHLGDLSEASGRMHHVGAPVAGLVINGVHGSMAGYAYGYRYGYRYRYSGNYGYGS